MSRNRIVGWMVGLLMTYPFVHRGVDWVWPRTRPVDAEMAAAGKQLFEHEWTPRDPLAAGGDGLGPVFNGRSCVECHRQGGVGGSGPAGTNVNVFTGRPTPIARELGKKPRQGVIHTQAIRPEFQETFRHVHAELSADLPSGSLPTSSVRTRSGVSDVMETIDLSQRKTPSLFGAALIDGIPDRDIIANERAQRLKWGLATSDERDKPIGRALRMTDGRIGRFGWKAQTVSLAEFVQAACANELGLGNPGQAQPVPLGRPDYRSPGFDLTQAQCAQLTEFIHSLPRPVERGPVDDEDASAPAPAGL